MVVVVPGAAGRRERAHRMMDWRLMDQRMPSHLSPACAGGRDRCPALLATHLHARRRREDVGIG